MARPTIYSEEILKAAEEYLYDFETSEEVIPSIAGLALRLKVSRKTLHNWMADEDKSEFLHIIEAILAKQESALVNKGLAGDFNPTVTKLILSKHGYSEKQEVEISGGDVTPWGDLEASVDG